jgi:heterodisulfide reductase subunit B
MKYAYFPGCSAESTARDQYTSTISVAEALGIKLVEPEGWTCCGSTPAHQVNHNLAVSLAALNLLKAKEMGLDMVVSCASCYSRMKAANYEIIKNPETRKNVSEALGKDYDGSVRVRHFIEVLLEDIGIESLKKSFKQSLNGLKVASYYGCLLVRPNEITGFDDEENPVYMDRLIAAMGGEGLDWPHKTECCGASLTISRPDIVSKLSDSIIGMAKDSGAECIAVACPMCQMNLDMRQSDILKETGRRYNMPVFYITQLIGLCLGLSKGDLGLGRLINSPKEVMDKVASYA